jgi:hypothetical protein
MAMVGFFKLAIITYIAFKLVVSEKDIDIAS